MRLTSWFRRWVAEGQDKAWKATGIRQVFVGYDEAAAVSGYERSRRQTATGRPIVARGEAKR